MDRERVAFDRETSLLRETAEDQLEYTGRILALDYDGPEELPDAEPRLCLEYGEWGEPRDIVIREHLPSTQQTLQQLEEELRDTAETFPPVEDPYRFEDHFAETGPEYVNVFVKEDGETETLTGEPVRRVLPLPRHTNGPTPDAFTAVPQTMMEDILQELEADAFSTFLYGFRDLNAYELKRRGESTELTYFPEPLDVTGIDLNPDMR